MRSSHSISEMSVQCPFISIIQLELGMGQNRRGIGLQQLRQEFLLLTDAE
jgi:hypothetical protein